MRQLVFLLLFVSLASFSQGKRILYKAKLQTKNEDKYPEATILIGDVVMKHEGATLTSKKAFYYQNKNLFIALGNVKINQGDTIFQNSDFSNYDGNLKRAKSWGNVSLRDSQMTLKTDTLYFDRVEQTLYYQDNATIINESNTLKSKKGGYFLAEKKFTAKNQVTVENPENLLESDFLTYYTESGLAYLYGPSTITNKKNNNKIYCERGFYDTNTDVSYFVKNAKLFLKDRTISADSLYYDRKSGFASASNRIKVIDTLQNFVAKGNYAELFENKDSLFMVDRAVAISIIEKDSMYIHGDTLLVTGKPKTRDVRIFHDVKIFKSDLQGSCDSIHTSQKTGITKMFYNPVLWSGENQITGDHIQLLSDTITEKMDSLKVLQNAFIIQKDSLDHSNFNQIKGKIMLGKFIDNQLSTLWVKGNTEAINYNRNSEGVLETITKQLCSQIEFGLEDNQIISIKCLIKSDGKTYPPSLFPVELKKLRGFIWREEEQPKKKEDIFVDGKIIPRKNIKKPKFLDSKDLNNPPDLKEENNDSLKKL